MYPFKIQPKKVGYEDKGEKKKNSIDKCTQKTRYSITGLRQKDFIAEEVTLVYLI